MELKVALYPGSFDPITFGHIDVLKRARTIFDKVVVAILENESKKPLFTLEERLEMVREAIKDIQGTEVISYSGLTVDAARAVGAVAMIRGLRAYSDFDVEFQMDLMNRKLCPDITTVFLMTSLANVYVSSSRVKEISRFGGSVDEFVPPIVVAKLKEKFAASREGEGNEKT
jgi:pantetheine-phosphate adenylyltransferase